MFKKVFRKCFRLGLGVLVLLLTLQQSLRADINVSEVPELHPEVTALFQKVWQAYQDKNFLAIMPLLNQTLAKSREVGDKAGETFSIFAFGEIYKKLGAVEKAAEYEVQARTLMEAGGDKAKAADIGVAIGTAYVAIGQERRSLEFYQRALMLRRELADKKGEAAVLILLGNIQGDYLGQTQTALTLYQQALALSREAKDEKHEAEALYYIGSSYSFEQSKEAVEYYQQALALWRKVGDEASQVRALYRISERLPGTRTQERVEMLQQALKLQRAVRDKQVKDGSTQAMAANYLGKRQEAILLISLGGIYMGQQKFQQALELFEQALPLSTEAGHKAGRASVLQATGTLYDKMGQPAKGLEFLQQSLQLYRESENKPITAIMLLWVASIEEKQGRLADAETHRGEGLMLLEELRESIGGQSTAKMGFLEDRLHHYYAHISSLLKAGKTAEAFAWAERTKARALLDLMVAGKVDITKDVSAAEQQQERTLRQHVDTLNQQMIAATANDPKRADALKPQLAQAETDLQAFIGVLYAEHPGLAQKRAAKTATLEDVAQFLPTDTVLLNYVALGKDADKGSIVLFAVTNEGGKGNVQSYIIEQPRDELIELLDDFRNACADPQKSYKSKARELYTLLVSPAAPQLAGKQRLLICPDGPLWGLPFQALMTGEQFLQEQYEVTYAYSATGAQVALAANARRVKPTKTLLALANPDFGGPERFKGVAAEAGTSPIAGDGRPITADARALTADSRALTAESRAITAESRGGADENPLRAILSRDGGIKPLPGTQREADALKADFPDATINTGAQAQESAAKQQGSDFRYLHFATHGLFNDAAPLLSSVVLAQPAPGSPDDGFLTAREIFDLNWNADMVVLSACDTGRGTKRSGEGVIGLTWAVFVAGVPTQLVSQWAVNDASTADLMKLFYAQIKAGKAKGAALREANLKLMKDGQHDHPFYWAPFILLGDWRN